MRHELRLALATLGEESVWPFFSEDENSLSEQEKFGPNPLKIRKNLAGDQANGSARFSPPA